MFTGGTKMLSSTLFALILKPVLQEQNILPHKNIIIYMKETYRPWGLLWIDNVPHCRPFSRQSYIKLYLEKGLDICHLCDICQPAKAFS